MFNSPIVPSYPLILRSNITILEYYDLSSYSNIEYYNSLLSLSIILIVSSPSQYYHQLVSSSLEYHHDIATSCRSIITPSQPRISSQLEYSKHLIVSSTSNLSIRVTEHYIIVSSCSTINPYHSGIITLSTWSSIITLLYYNSLYHRGRVS